MNAGQSQHADETDLGRARALLGEGQLDQSLIALTNFWLKHPENPDATGLCADILKAANREIGAEALRRLAETLSEKDNGENGILERNPDVTFEAGYHLIDARAYELAVMLLQHCLASAPNDSTLNYELGFALMSTGNYEEALKRFDVARKSQDDFDTTLNMAVCHALLRKLKECKDLLSTLKKQAQTDEEKQELQHREVVLKRLEKLSKKKQMTARDWLFALYGTTKLYTPEGTRGATIIDDSTQERTETFRSIAATLLVLKGVLEGLRLTPEAVEFYNAHSRPLAAVLARLLDVALDSYRGPDRPDHALLVMDWASDIIGPHESFVGHATNRSIFAFGMPRSEALPLIPDIVAHFTDKINLPWSDDGAVDADGTPLKTAEEVIPEILERAWNMESDPDILKAIQDSVEYYSDKKELLVLGNPVRFPQRPEYSAEVPAAAKSASAAG